MVGHDVVAVIVCLITPSLSLINHPPTPNRKLNLSLIAECSYIKVASELIKGSFNPVLFKPPYLKLLQVNIKITSKKI